MADIVAEPQTIFNGSKIIEVIYQPLYFQQPSNFSSQFSKLGWINYLAASTDIFQNNAFVSNTFVNKINTEVIALESLTHYTVEFNADLLVVGDPQGANPKIYHADLVSWGSSGQGDAIPIDLGAYIRSQRSDTMQAHQVFKIDRNNAPSIMTIGKIVKARFKTSYGYNGIVSDMQNTQNIYALMIWIKVTGYKK